MIVVGGACAGIMKVVDTVEKEQALLVKDQAMLKLSVSKDHDILARDIEISHLKSQVELNTTFTSMGYGAEYIEWRAHVRAMRVKEGMPNPWTLAR